MFRKLYKGIKCIINYEFPWCRSFARHLDLENKLIISVLTGEPLSDKDMREYNEYIEESNKVSIIGSAILLILTIIAIIACI